MVSLQAHNGDTFSAYPWHQTPQCLWHSFFVVISDDQSTKHRVTLFHYVVYSPCSSTRLNGHQCHPAVTVAKIHYFSERCKKESEKFGFLRKKHVSAPKNNGRVPFNGIGDHRSIGSSREQRLIYIKKIWVKCIFPV